MAGAIITNHNENPKQNSNSVYNQISNLYCCSTVHYIPCRWSYSSTRGRSETSPLYWPLLLLMHVGTRKGPSLTV